MVVEDINKGTMHYIILIISLLWIYSLYYYYPNYSIPLIHSRHGQHKDLLFYNYSLQWNKRCSYLRLMFYEEMMNNSIILDDYSVIGLLLLLCYGHHVIVGIVNPYKIISFY